MADELKAGPLAVVYAITQLTARAQSRMLSLTLAPSGEAPVLWRASLGGKYGEARERIEDAVIDLERVTR